ncbi:MAG: P-loop containing nucleoside triphosphate hydrolase protein [Olpidium bornovanus]|uniref:P-loop containing nucleoside triphosphate hydrolase protein n=1 Tax=Olpidium bornovanus TaxID=278681 RepID=A0A8H7ZUE2_9FUNG|nr:MAG: P-loop containing nucleoside triphosphate hydrolase protein [Olpidium bornovanus]
MFDMGFEPQVMKILKNVRPQRQTVLFSATFPKQMEALARKVLRRPLEITVGGRSVVCEDVKQIVEVREDATKFVRLLEILGNYFMEDKEGKALIFVDRQEAADNLLRDLIRRSYLCMSLHGGKDQTDRESTISDFKSGVTQIVIATSVAARGLDVKGLGLVINYECPNHLEDYVHRVGRTGRAGQKGTAYTFVTPDQDRYAVEVAKALKISGQDVPPDLAALVTGFQEKVKSGQVKFFGSGGFGGKGLEQLDKERDLTYGDDAEEASEDEEGAKAAKNAEVDAKAKTPAETKEKAEGPHDNGPASPGKPPATPKTPVNAALAQAQAAAAAIQLKAANPAAAKAQSLIAELNAQIASAGVGTGKGKEGKLVPGTSPYSYEFEINDYPQKARWKATNKENISQVIESTGAAITTRGIYVEPGKPIPPGERKLYLIIEGEEQEIVDRAKAEIKRILTEATVSAMEQEVKTGGRYSVV